MGIAGTGGARAPGDGDLNVLELKDPLLPRRCTPLVNGCRAPLVALPMEDTEPLRTIRFVWSSEMGAGDVVCDRNAAAAAAFDKRPSSTCFLTKAWAAAEAAEGVGLLLTGACDCDTLDVTVELMKGRRYATIGIYSRAISRAYTRSHVPD